MNTSAVFTGLNYSLHSLYGTEFVFFLPISDSLSCLCYQNFYTFLFLRAMVGVGEASYSTIAPTIIADLFVRDIRTKALTVFYIAIPLGR